MKQTIYLVSARLVAVLLVALLLPPALHAQTPVAGAPGTIVPVKSTLVNITAGLLRCTLSTSNAGTNTSLYCYLGNALMFNASAAILTVTDQPNGPHAGYGLGPDLVSVVFWRTATGQPVQWQITANGKTDTGTF